MQYRRSDLWIKQDVRRCGMVMITGDVAMFLRSSNYRRH